MKEDTVFTVADLVSFGKFLLSDSRRQRLEQEYDLQNVPDRLQEVSHADICNWYDRYHVSV